MSAASVVVMPMRCGHRLHSYVDFVVCLGGDGTILHASSLFQRAIPPVISFSLGSLGFLTNHTLASAEDDLRGVIYGCEDLDQCALDEEVGFLPFYKTFDLGSCAAHLHVCLWPFFLWIQKENVLCDLYAFLQLLSILLFLEEAWIANLYECMPSAVLSAVRGAHADAGRARDAAHAAGVPHCAAGRQGAGGRGGGVRGAE